MSSNETKHVDVYRTYPEWVRCPDCGGEVAVAWGEQGRIGFDCQDCAATAPPSYGDYVVGEIEGGDHPNGDLNDRRR